MEAIIFCGIQASGKTTFYKERFFDTHLRINLDMLKTRHRENLLLAACFEMKQPFVVDNTNPTIEERAKYITRAKEARFRVVGYYFQSNLGAALERNEGRTGRAHIPNKGIIATFRKFQPPTFDEGFDQLFAVSIDKNGNFVVKELQRNVENKMSELLTRITPFWYRNSGATEEQIQHVEQGLPFELPHDYKEFLRWSNGGEGKLGSTYLSLWKVEEISQLNNDYQITHYLPNVLGIGSDGGSQCITLDYRANSAQPSLVKVPFGALETESITVLGSSFYEAVSKMINKQR
jgi:predicted kinase